MASLRPRRFASIPRALLAAALSFSAVACATKGDVQDARSSLAADIGQARETQEVLRARLDSVRVQLDRMEARQKDLILGRSSELQRQIQQLQDQIARLTALVGQTRQRLETGLRQRAAPTEGGEAAADTSGPGAGEAWSGDPAALYEAALEQFRREAYETARGALQEFLSRYPDHRLAPDARYYLGRSQEETGQVDTAMTAYRRVVQLHPNSNRAPSALYRLGMVHLDRGESEEARRLFQQIIRGYPDSPEAKPATRQLEEIGGS